MGNSEPKWRLVERVVKLLEQAITPDARIKHNVMMPDLTDASQSRECDIVIWTGKLPRETITIVEVQDRNKPFDITTFDGMCTKMRKVGAQHLICVSRQSFPISIKNEAKRQGPTVRLVLLKDLEDGNWPVNIVDSCVYLVERKILAITNVKFGVKPGEIPTELRSSQTSSDEKVFCLEGYQKKYSFADLNRFQPLSSPARRK